MSIFSKLLQSAVKPIIIKEIRRRMDNLLKMAIDLIKALVTPQQGTKFLITTIGIGALTWLSYKGLATTPVVIGVVAVVLSYHLSNIWLTSKGMQNGNGATKPGDNGNGGVK